MDDPSDPQTLWFGTDAGLASASAVVKDDTPVFASYYNEYLGWEPPARGERP